jgi:hypothetical protein
MTEPNDKFMYLEPGSDEPPHPEVIFDQMQTIVPNKVEGLIDTKAREVGIYSADCDNPGIPALTHQETRQLKIWLDYAWSMLRHVTEYPGGKPVPDEEVAKRMEKYYG